MENSNLPTLQTDNAMVSNTQARQWGMWLHLSVLLTYIFPLVGVLAPLGIWWWKKDEVRGLGVHARNLINGTVSYWLYSLVATMLTWVLIGWPALAVLGIAWFVVPTVAALKARSGEAWRYPLALPIVK